MKILPLFFLLFFVSCANYVSNLHRQIDREEKVSRGDTREGMREHYSPYKNRFNRENDKRPVKDPHTFSMSDGGPSNQLQPPVKREYRPQRYKANDFVDSDSGGSLWANQGSSSSLFTYQNDKHTGDMVIINVLENLRNQISSELKRVFPDKPKKVVAGAKGDAKNPAAQPPATSNQPREEEMDMKIYDKISGTVMEEISKDYILLRGRKEVIFKKEKQSIEVQGLVSRKDIMENDYVNSDRLLDSRVFIIRQNQ
jgi:flagellar basal body L-ring protein FlgH